MSILSIVVAVVVVAVVAVLILAARRPDRFAIARSRTIRAPAAELFPLIDDLRAHSRWSPFDRPDPKTRKHYSGAAHGVGAVYEWAGGSSGSGRIEITAAEPPLRIVMRLSMQKPIRADNTVTFTLAERAGATDVTWAIDGGVPFTAKILHVFIDMDRVCGGAFESGLAELAKLVEQ